MTRISRRGVIAGGSGLALSSLYASARAHEVSAPIGAWVPVADMPFPVQEIYPAPFWRKANAPKALKPTPYNIIVNAGGLAPGALDDVTDKVTYYDPQENAWFYGPSLPQARHHLSLVNNNGYLYGIGGFYRDPAGGWQMRADSWRLGDIDGEWARMAPMPHPQAETVCESLGGFIHVVGGRAPSGSRNREWSDHIDTDEHWLYDAASNRWVDLAPLPTPRNSSAGAVLNGVLYVMGGRTVRGGNSAAVEVYDPLSDRWEQARPMPKAQAGLAAAVSGGKIYAFGGEYFSAAGGGVFADAWEYDPRADRWRAIAAMPRPRHGLGAVAMGGAIYVMGGAAKAGGEATSTAVDMFSI